jgi:hypothetical protein
VVVATAPLTRDEAWQAYAPGEARVFADGRCTWVRGARPVPTSAVDGAWADSRPQPLPLGA